MRLRLALIIPAVTSVVTPALATRVENPIAVFAGLDKITGLITTFEVKIGEEKRFGGLLVKPDICYSRPVTEEPKTTSFVEVDEIETNETSQTRLFRLDVCRKPWPQRRRTPCLRRLAYRLPRSECAAARRRGAARYL